MLAADYVTTEDGTGIVHIAPAFGEEDKAVTDAAGIEVVVPVDSRGEFDSRVPPYEGLQVFDANPQIIRDLKAGAPYVHGVLLRHETYDHPYPHCWRCDNPLIQRAVSSWFVAVTTFRDRMVELNQADHLGARARQGRPVRQVAGGRPGLVDLPQPVLGQPDPGLDVRRPGLPAHRRLRLAGRAGARLRGAARPTCTGPTSTS